MNYNVLFKGRPGVGKTSIIHDAFSRNGLKYKYFSGSTMDPWTDLVGIPKNKIVTNYEGKDVDAVELIPPADLVKNKYDVIFIDELNRAPPKVLNALLEILQFKSINGNPVPIKAIWAAINPFGEDDDYQVEMLDPAMEDRFQIQIAMPYKLDETFLLKKHGQVANTFSEWWNSQPEEIQHKVSPRRLSDTIELYKKGGDVQDMIYHGNTDLLNKNLKDKASYIRLLEAMEQNNLSAIQNILSQNIPKSIEKIILDKNNFETYFDYINPEWISLNVISNETVFQKINKISQKNENAKKILINIYTANPKSVFVLKNIDSFKPNLDKNTVEKIEIENAKLINIISQKAEDPSLLSFSDNFERVLLTNIRSTFYFYNHKLPTLSKNGNDPDIYKYLSFSLSKINSSLTSNMNNIYSQAAKSGLQDKCVATLALNLALLKHMAEARYEAKPNGVYQKFKNLFDTSFKGNIYDKLVNNLDLKDVIDEKYEMINKYLLKLPDHGTLVNNMQQIANLHLIGLWILKNPEANKHENLETFVYNYSPNSNPALASVAEASRTIGRRIRKSM